MLGHEKKLYSDLLINPNTKRLDKIKESVNELEKHINAFQGDKDDKEFNYFNEIVTRYRNALNAINTNGDDDLEEKCKETLMRINQCKFILERNSLGLFYPSLPSVTKQPFSLQPDMIGVPTYKSHLSTSSESLGQSGFQNMANEHKTDERIALFSKIRKIRNITSDLEKQIIMFQGLDMEEYRYLDEMLSSNLFALDSIDTTNIAHTQPEEALDLRQKRKEIVKWNQKLLSDLDSKLIKQPGSNSQLPISQNDIAYNILNTYVFLLFCD